MPRSGGVTASAVVTIAGSLLMLLLAGLMVVTAAVAPIPRNVAFARVSLWFSAGFFLFLAAWGIATAVGLFKLQVWSRISILIFSGLLALICGMSGLAIAFMPFPPGPNGQVLMPTAVRLGIALFYGSLALLGAVWIFFFTRSTVIVQFEGGDFAARVGARPLSITIISIYLFFTAAVSLVLVFLPFPTALIGLMLKGWPAHLVYVVWFAVALALGAALWKMNPLARKATVVFFVFVIVNRLLYAWLPGAVDSRKQRDLASKSTHERLYFNGLFRVSSLRHQQQASALLLQATRYP